jgi:hypothetical protein
VPDRIPRHRMDRRRPPDAAPAPARLTDPAFPTRSTWRRPLDMKPVAEIDDGACAPGRPKPSMPSPYQWPFDWLAGTRLVLPTTAPPYNGSPPFFDQLSPSHSLTTETVEPVRRLRADEPARLAVSEHQAFTR